MEGYLSAYGWYRDDNSDEITTIANRMAKLQDIITE